ncbi:MAG: DNA-processing protein DprA, partial [Candidatus Zixiibacteriota bacterium]
IGTRAVNGKSFAILNSGFNNIYPEENKPLAIDIAKNGGLLSEYPPDKEYSPVRYKSSNRIIAGMAQAVIVTEFYNDSEVILDLLSCCSQIGKLTFIMIDPMHGALTDKDCFNKAVSFGAIPLVGLDKTDDIIQSLV